MKRGKKIVVGLAAALAIAMFAAGAVSTVTVSAFNVNINIIETDFGQVLPGQVIEMHSFDVSSDANAIVEARFTTEGGGVYGFTGGSVSVIPAENFTINGTALNNNGGPMEICIVESGETKEFHTKLHVPLDQTGADYSGIVELTFTPEIPEPTSEPTPAPTSEPTPAPTSEPTPAPTSEPPETSEDDEIPEIP
jgi:hypothetical protein